MWEVCGGLVGTGAAAAYTSSCWLIVLTDLTTAPVLLLLLMLYSLIRNCLRWTCICYCSCIMSVERGAGGTTLFIARSGSSGNGCTPEVGWCNG